VTGKVSDARKAKVDLHVFFWLCFCLVVCCFVCAHFGCVVNTCGMSGKQEKKIKMKTMAARRVQGPPPVQRQIKMLPPRATARGRPQAPKRIVRSVQETGALVPKRKKGSKARTERGGFTTRGKKATRIEEKVMINDFATSLVDPFGNVPAIVPDSNLYAGVPVGDTFTLNTPALVDSAGGTSTTSCWGVAVNTGPKSMISTLASYTGTTGAMTWNAATDHPLYAGTLLPNFCAARPVSLGVEAGWWGSLANASGVFYALQIDSGPASSTSIGVLPDNIAQVSQDPHTSVLNGADVEEGGIRKTWVPNGTGQCTLVQNLATTFNLSAGTLVVLWLGNLASGTAAASPVPYNILYTIAANWECFADAATDPLFPSKMKAGGSDDSVSDALREVVDSSSAIGSTIKSAAEFMLDVLPGGGVLKGLGKIGSAVMDVFGLFGRHRRLMTSLLSQPGGFEFVKEMSKRIQGGMDAATLIKSFETDLDTFNGNAVGVTATQRAAILSRAPKTKNLLNSSLPVSDLEELDDDFMPVRGRPTSKANGSR
jgi:hypothetical protein